jgi:hypothetical protein
MANLMANEAASEVRRVVIYDDAETELRTASPFTQSKDLWVTLAELTRSTGFVLKPQGKVAWFNLSEFARLVKQPVAHEEKLATWYFGPRPEAQNGYLANLEAPNFTLPDRSGKLHSLSGFRGKKVLLITWASW